jgi:2,4-dienoyl-CoA reductase-like NADH-dependent reductase (Old Yellow Enzyme family)
MVSKNDGCSCDVLLQPNQLKHLTLKNRIWTYSEQRATATEFHLISRLKAWSGEELIFEEEKAHVIPRNGM